VKRMCTNCKMYNGPDTVYYACADELEKCQEEFNAT